MSSIFDGAGKLESVCTQYRIRIHPCRDVCATREDEFFDLETFSSRGDFLAKATLYQLYFNLVRLNSHKGYQSPWQIVERLASRSPLELCLLPPVFFGLLP